MIPGSANPLLLASAAGGYEIERSVRFNSSDSAYLSRTPASAGNRRTFTLAAWCKRSNPSSNLYLISSATNLSGSSDEEFNIRFLSTGELYVQDYKGFGPAVVWKSSAVFRDPSAWLHVCVSFDSTQASASNAVTAYVNGSQITMTPTVQEGVYTQNREVILNSTYPHAIGRQSAKRPVYSNGYLADIHFIDGQVLDQYSFGDFDTNGIWQPIEYTGTYGTNGFHLPLSDNSTAAALGTDTSGNSNTWTVNNISVTAGAGNDSLVDVPTNGTASSGGDAGGVTRGNYCTWNPLINGDTAANGNLDVTNDTARGTQNLLNFDAYWEITSTGGTTTAGVVSDSGTTNTTTVADTKTYGFKLSAAGSLDYINITDGGSFTNITTGLTGVQFPYASAASATTGSLNAGQRPFAASAPAGFKGICTANLPAPVVTKPSEYMDIALYQGNGTTQTISGLNFSPDFVWIKVRSSNSYGHRLLDTIRGVTKELYSNLTNAEATVSNGLTSFNTDGFTTGDNPGANASGESYVAWTWDAGDSTVSNPDGSITSSVRANPSAGFSIVTYTGTGANGTVGHGLGVTPSLLIVKNRDGVYNWRVWHKQLSSTEVLWLNTTDAVVTGTTTQWNSTLPSSTVFSLGTDSGVNQNTTNYVAYCFAPVDGYSTSFSYTGNGNADGPFSYLGFLPKLILIKCSSTTGNWVLLDTEREGYNVDNDPLFPNLSNAEATTDLLDITSNGFKIRSTNADVNTNAATYIGYAWAESPFQSSRAR